MNIGQLSMLTLALAFGSAAGAADQKWSGYLCCNVRTTGSWISDINYQEAGKHVIPAGTPVDVIGYGRHRVRIKVEGREEAIGNDYSRDLLDETLARRYIVTDDVAAKIAALPKAVQTAISQGRLLKGMSKEQVLMSVGYPVSSENPRLEDKTWRFWLSSFSEFRVHFDDAGIVVSVDGDPDARDKVYAE